MKLSQIRKSYFDIKEEHDMMDKKINEALEKFEMTKTLSNVFAEQAH